VGLSSEEPSRIREFVKAADMNYTIGFDAGEKIAASYLREGIPMFVIIDKRGIVRRIVVGSDMDSVEAALPPLLQ
jgi:peroxiredoxin